MNRDRLDHPPSGQPMRPTSVEPEVTGVSFVPDEEAPVLSQVPRRKRATQFSPVVQAQVPRSNCHR